MGSDSDWEVMQKARDTLREFGVPCVCRVLSAHRSPDAVRGFVQEAAEQGVGIFIAGAGGAAHLAGTVAAWTTRPVLGVPLDASPLHGLDSLLSTVQMPAGIPVGTTAVGPAGATNAALLAVAILALSDQGLDRKLKEYRKGLAARVSEKDQCIRESSS
jgi:phosphoribosylaminoimidazole carboxylase PurE protein